MNNLYELIALSLLYFFAFLLWNDAYPFKFYLYLKAHSYNMIKLIHNL